MMGLAIVPVTLRGLRLRPMTLIGPLVAVAFSVAASVIALSVIVAASSEDRAEPVRYRAADVVVAVSPEVVVSTYEDEDVSYRPQDPAGLTASDLDRLRRGRGVSAVVADMSSPGALLVDGSQVGADDEATVVRGWSSLRLSGTRVVRGSRPGPGEIAVPDGRGLDVGDTVTLATPSGATATLVAAVVEDEGIEGQLSVLVDDEYAAELAHGQTLAVGVFTDGDPQDLRDVLEADFSVPGITDDRLLVLAGEDRARAEPDRRSVLLEDTVSLAGVVMFVSGAVAVFTTANTFALGMLRRRGEFALLRLVGATRRQIRLGIMLEAVVVALLGAVPGILVGLLLTPVFTWQLVKHGLAPEGFSGEATPWVLVGSTGMAVLVALVAARSASRRGSKVRPVEAAGEANADVRRPGVLRLLFGLVCVTAAVAVPFFLPGGLEVAVAGAVLLSWLALVGLSALGPVLVPRLAGGLLRIANLIRRLAGRPAPLGDLPAAASRRAIRRTTATAMPIAVSVGLAATLFGLVGMAVDGSSREAAKLVTADMVVLPGPSGTIASDAADSFSRIDGVETAMPLLTSQVVAGPAHDMFERAAWLVDPAELDEVTALPVTSGDLHGLGLSTVALSENLAASMGDLEVGDTATFWGPDGTMSESRVVALLDLPLLSVEAILPFNGEVEADRLLIGFDPELSGPALERARAEVAAAAEKLGASAAPSADLQAEVIKEQERGNRLALRVILAIAVLLGAVSVANTVLMSVEERQGEASVLRLLGAEPRQVRSWLMTECAGVVAAGLALGLTVYVITAVPMLISEPALGPGLPMPVMDVWIVGGFLSLVAVVTTLLGPGRVSRA
jgi:putative ABC transport system permease protein